VSFEFDACFECQYHGRPSVSCRCRRAFEHLTGGERRRGVRCYVHDSYRWEQLPLWMTSLVACSSPPAVWSKDVEVAHMPPRHFNEPVWHRAVAMRMMDQQLVKPRANRCLGKQRQPKVALSAIERPKATVRCYNYAPPQVPMPSWIECISRVLWKDPVFMAFFPTTYDETLPRFFGSAEQEADLWMALRRAAKKSKYTVSSERLIEYMNIQAIRDGGVQNTGYDAAVLRKLPSACVFHGIGTLAGAIPGVGPDCWKRSNYPAVIVGVNGMLSGGLVPVYTWDGIEFRTRSARFVVTKTAGGVGAPPVYSVGLRIESCQVCEAWPRDKGVFAKVRMCGCSDLRLVPHMGDCGIGHALRYGVACLSWKELPGPLQSDVCAWRASPSTYCYDSWALRKEESHGVCHVPLASEMPPVFDLNMARFLDPELRDYYLSRGQRFVAPGQYGYQDDLMGDPGDLVQLDDYVQVGACSDLVEIIDGARVMRLHSGEGAMTVYMDDARDLDQEL